MNWFKLDGFVKSPSAALRFTPALLDQKLRIEGIGRGSNFQEMDSSWGLSNRVNRCGVPCKYASLLRFCAPCIWNSLLCHPNFDFLRDHQTYATCTKYLVDVTILLINLPLPQVNWKKE